MKMKPTETRIVDYLFGELNVDELQQFEEYMQDNPGFAKEVNELRLTQQLLPALNDEEVIPHIPLVGSKKLSPINNQLNKWLLPLSIAASISALLIVGYFTQFNLSFAKGGFELGFNKSIPSLESKGLTRDEVQDMINTGLILTSNSINKKMDEIQLSFAARLEKNNRLTKAEIQLVASEKSKIDDEQIVSFIAQLKEENKRNIQSFYQANANQQQKYMQIMLQDFNEYLAKQRTDDLNAIRLGMQEIHNNSLEQQQETDKILANIITTVNSRNSAGM